MSGWFSIVALIITTIGGSLGVTFLNNRKELLALKMKIQKENDSKIESKLREYIDYIEKRLETSNKRFEELYQQYVVLQNESIKREAELQSEKQKTINAVRELEIVKKEYQELKSEFVQEKKRLEDDNASLSKRCNELSDEMVKLRERMKVLEVHQCQIENVLDQSPITG